MGTKFTSKTLYLLLASLWPGLIFAAQSMEPDGTISVAFYESGFLYSQGKGIDPDVLAELKKRGGYHFTYMEQPRARTWKALQDGTLSMTVSAIRTPEREAFAYFIPYHAQKNMALTMRSDLRTPADLIADPMARIAVVRGFKHGETYDQIIEQLTRDNRVIEVSSIRNLFLMLGAGHRIDVIFSLPVFYRKELLNVEMGDKVRIMDWSPNTPPVQHHLALSKAHFSKQEYLRMASIVEGMREDGTLRRLMGRYLPGDDLEKASLR